METDTLPQVVEKKALTAAEVRMQVNLIQEVMKAVMKKDVHYGIIPGTPKPTLYKAGAEKLLVTFRIAADSPIIEDLSTLDTSRYRVTRPGKSIYTGNFLGSGVGECSSDEEKFCWRKPVCPEEFYETPEDHRRDVWKRIEGKPTKIKQVRTRPADVANTILKMADKRAYVALTLQITAASDIFTQDIEDLPEGLDVVENHKCVTVPGPEVKKPNEKPESKVPDPKTTNGEEVLSISFVPTICTTKPTKKEGQKRYAIQSPDGGWLSTFDDAQGAVIAKAREQKQILSILYAKDGDFNNICDVQIVPK